MTTLSQTQLRIISKIATMEGNCEVFLLTDIEGALDKWIGERRASLAAKTFSDIEAMIFGPRPAHESKEATDAILDARDKLLYCRSVIRGEIKGTREDCGTVACVRAIRACCGIGLWEAKQYYDKFVERR